MDSAANKPPVGYFVPAEITDPAAFLLDGRKKPAEQYEQAMTQLRRYVETYADNFAGYQSTARLDTKHLAPFIEYAINNIGDSFSTPGARGTQLADGYFGLNSKWIERAVLDYFADKWHAPRPRRVKEDDGELDGFEPPNCTIPAEHWLNSYWGYVLSMGSTEGNLMALRSARDYLKGRKLLYDGEKPSDPLGYVDPESALDGDESERNPVLLYSDQSHYSVKKIAQILEIEARIIKTDKHGQMDLEHLVAEARDVLMTKRRPPIVLFNYGTTWSGALDNVEAAIARLMPMIRDAGFDCRKIIHRDERGNETECWRRGFWFHVDGALGAGYASFTETDADGEKLPVFDFRNDIMSIVMSGHKWPGAPWPTGIYMTLNKYMMTNDVPAVVGALDSTLAGSRSGIAPIFFWDWLARASDDERKAEVDAALALAKLAAERIPGAIRAPGSIMAIFPRPSDAIVRKYSLASITHKDEQGNEIKLSHLVCMRHVDAKLVLRLIGELRPADAADASVAGCDDEPAFEPDFAHAGW